MNRLLLAVPGALVVHLMVLLTFVPQQSIVKPEIEGSGQITVSIIHSSPSKEVFIEEPDVPGVDIQEDDPVGTADKPIKNSEVTRVVEQKPMQTISEETVTVESPEEPEIEKVPVVQQENSKDTVAEEEMQTALQEQRPEPQVQNRKSTYSAVQEVLKDPEPLDNLNKPPEYPELARKRGWEGTVLLQVHIAGNGMVKEIGVKQSSSFALLDNAAMDAVRKWHFQPGSKGGQFVDMQVLVPVHFVLQEK